MKDSFLSFEQASIDRWIINARGPLADKALDFLRNNLGKRLVDSKIETGRGWFHDTRLMLKLIESDYVLYWIEDQMCLCGPDRLSEVIGEMKTLDIEYMGYSWFGLGAFESEFSRLNRKSLDYTSVFEYDKQAHKIRIEDSLKIIGIKSAIISLAGIFSKTCFSKLVQDRRFYFRRWPKNTPFDFERMGGDIEVLPLKYGVPKVELFCAIDDDNHTPGSSLISRGLYPERRTREDLLELRESSYKKVSLLWLRKILRRYALMQKIYRFMIRLFYNF
jgi:hypothetical protein